MNWWVRPDHPQNCCVTWSPFRIAICASLYSVCSDGTSRSTPDSAWPEVLAVVLSGSHATRIDDAESDLDMYVYCDTAPAIESRVALAQGRASANEVDNRFWETGDEWLEAQTGMQVDVTFRTRAWIEERLAKVLERFEPFARLFRRLSGIRCSFQSRFMIARAGSKHFSGGRVSRTPSSLPRQSYGITTRSCAVLSTPTLDSLGGLPRGATW